METSLSCSEAARFAVWFKCRVSVVLTKNKTGAFFYLFKPVFVVDGGSIIFTRNTKYQLAYK